MNSASLNFRVDEDLCTRCGLCVSDCPSRIISLEGDAVPRIPEEREGACIHCQHCLAICPEGAVTIDGFDPAASHLLAGTSFPNLEQMDLFVRGRRSVRQYRDENVDPTLIRRLLDALVHAPTGVNRRSLTFTVIQDKTVLAALRVQVMDALSKALETNPVPGNATYLAQMIAAWRDEGRDVIFRGAPHLLLVSTPPDTPTPQQDVPLTLAYFELLAQSAGLGTVWLGLLKRAFEIIPDLKHLLGLPQDHIYYPMLFGYPAIHYTRTVQREGTAQIREVTGIPA